MKPKVWLRFPLLSEAMARLEAVAEIVLDPEQERLAGVDVVVGGGRQIDGEFMDKVGPNLKLIAMPGIGVDHIDLPAASARGIIVINNPDAPTESTAEHTVALLMAVAKRVMMGDIYLRGASEIPRSAMRGTELRDRILGVVGYGRIGKRVAEICALGIKMRVLAYDPYLAGQPSATPGVEMIDSLDDLLQQADFVTLHTPLTPETRHFFGERELRLMRPGTYLINASRGPVLDEAALIRVLQDGHLAGAGLDVFDPEPPGADNPLLKMTNVVVTPHIASSTDRGFTAMMNGTADQIIQVLRGERPPFMVNPEAWPGRVKAS